MSFIADMASTWTQWWASVTTTQIVWLLVGLLGQVMFAGRWFIQWIASERVRQAIVPETFWYFSLIGGIMVLAYGLYKREPVIIIGQFGVFIYARNIYFLWQDKKNEASQASKSGSSTPAP